MTTSADDRQPEVRRPVALTHEQARVLNIVVHNATRKERDRIGKLRERHGEAYAAEISEGRLRTLLSLSPELDALLKRFG